MRGIVAFCVAAVVAAATPPRLGAAQAPVVPDRDALLVRVAAHLKTYERQFSAVVAEERYRQSITYPMGHVDKHRELRSDVMVLNAGGSHWVQVRDVYEVDNHPVRDHQARLLALLESPNATAFGGAAVSMANESARYNLGVTRNINVPTMALTYLTAENQPRSRFAVDGAEVVGGVRATVLTFRETRSPSLVRDANVDVPTSGRDWIDPASGAVLRTELTCVTASRLPFGPSATIDVGPSIRATVTVEYGRVPALRMLVPTSMEETYHLGRETDTGKATYSNFRSFEIDTSALFRSGGGF